MMRIEEYVKPICQIIIDEYNILFQGKGQDELRKIANQDTSESDIMFKIGNSFRQMAHYTVTVKDDHNPYKKNHDIVIRMVEDRTLIIEVKAPKGYKSRNKTNVSANGTPWKPYLKDLNWLSTEIANGERGNRALVFGWVNCVDYFGQIFQLGKGKHSGSQPDITPEKVPYFPFLLDSVGNGKVNDFQYRYDGEIGEYIIRDSFQSPLSCVFLGKQSDKYHFAIYY